MTDKRFEVWLERAAGELPREREPGRDLWPGIEARIATRRRRFVPLSAAASLLAAALALGIWFGRPGTGAPTMAPTAVEPRARLSALESAAVMEAQYRDALLAAAGRGGGLRVDDAQATLVRAELGQIEDAQRAIRRALQQQPDSAYLVSLLAQTHAQRIDLVQRLARGPQHEGDSNENGNV